MTAPPTIGLAVKGIKYFNMPFDYLLTSLFIFLSLIVIITILFTAKFNRRIQHFISRHLYRHKYDFKGKWLESIDKRNARGSLGEERVNIFVTDNGAGMTQEFIENSLFKPFVTTKKKGLGVGLLRPSGGYRGGEFRRRRHDFRGTCENNPGIDASDWLHGVSRKPLRRRGSGSGHGFNDFNR